MNRINDPKLLGDYMKFMMKSEYRNPSILRKIVAIHSSQSKKCRKRTYFLMKKLLKFKRKINYKLNLFYCKYLNTRYIKKYIKKKFTKKMHSRYDDVKYFKKKYNFYSKKSNLKKKKSFIE